MNLWKLVSLLMVLSVASGGTLEVAHLPDDQPVNQLVAFAGRLYPSAKAAGPVIIYSYVPGNLELQQEDAPAGTTAGAWKRTADGLYLPAAGGFYLSRGNGVWTREAAPLELVRDVVEFDGATFVAGSGEGAALVAWHRQDTEWTVANLNDQAARLAPEATQFLALGDQLSVLAPRNPPGEWPRFADPDWGAWYLLHYAPLGSARGFAFDGKARPLPVLEALAPSSSLPRNPACSLQRVMLWHDSLLYLTMRGNLLDPKGGLFRGTFTTGNPQVSRTLVGERVAGITDCRDIAAEGERCFLLCAADNQLRARILSSTDLKTWETNFEGELPAAALSLAVLRGELYLGLDNGAILQVTP